MRHSLCFSERRFEPVIRPSLRGLVWNVFGWPFVSFPKWLFARSFSLAFCLCRSWGATTLSPPIFWAHLLIEYCLLWGLELFVRSLVSFHSHSSANHVSTFMSFFWSNYIDSWHIFGYLELGQFIIDSFRDSSWDRFVSFFRHVVAKRLVSSLCLLSMIVKTMSF